MHSIQKLSLACVAAAATMLLSGCETTNMKMGSADAKTMATGAAAGGATDGASGQLERCSAPLGTVSLIENQQAGWYTILRNEYRLPPTANLLRLLVQQSNCFVVVERSAAGMNAMTRERGLMQSGEMRQGSNMGGGQMVASDYGLTPEVIFNNNNAGGTAASLGGAIGGRYGGLLGALSGSLNTKEASTLLTLIDNRSGVQVAASEGSASKTDFGAMGQLFGGSGGGGLGGYSNTAEGKVISAAFMDAFNQMVRALRSYKAQSVQGQAQPARLQHRHARRQHGPAHRGRVPRVPEGRGHSAVRPAGCGHGGRAGEIGPRPPTQPRLARAAAFFTRAWCATRAAILPTPSPAPGAATPC